MSATIACIAGEEAHRQVQTGRAAGRRIGSMGTPFGDSGEIFLVEHDAAAYYLMSRHGGGLRKTAPHRVNDRANMYALKDLGVQQVLSWAPAGAITHNIAVGDLVILSDIIDQTHARQRTFFEDSPLGFLRQFPVFCPSLRKAAADVLAAMKLVFQAEAVAAITEGPRLETPAEVRMLATIGAQLVTHAFVPEVFLARELQMCYAAVCYVVNYAETGSPHRPFIAADLFGGLTSKSDTQRLAGATAAMSQMMQSVAQLLSTQPPPCECDQTMAHHVRQYELSKDWRSWFQK